MSLVLLFPSGHALTQSVTDTLAGIDVASTAASVVLSFVDALALPDSATEFTAHAVIVTDDAGVRDGLTFSGVTDTVSLTDSVSFLVSYVVTDSLAGTDSSSFASAKVNVSNDVSALSDTVTTFSAHFASPVDDAGLVDTVVLFFSPVISDSAGLADPFVAPTLGKFQVPDDTAGLTDAVFPTLNAFISLAVTDVVGLTESILPSAAHFLLLGEDAGLRDTLTGSPGHNVAVTDLLAATDSAAVVDTPPTNYTMTVTELLGGSDSSGSQSDHFNSVIDLTGSSDTISFFSLHTALQFALSQLGLSDTIASAASFNMTVNDSVGLDTVVQRSQNRVNSGRVIQMVEYVNRMED